jgi:hypothetical protein
VPSVEENLAASRAHREAAGHSLNARRLEARLSAIQDQILDVFLAGALQAFARIQEDTAVDTGFLRASWHLEQVSGPPHVLIRLINAANYSVYIEVWGGKHTAPWMLARNVEMFRNDFALVAGEILKRGR